MNRRSFMVSHFRDDAFFVTTRLPETLQILHPTRRPGRGLCCNLRQNPSRTLNRSWLVQNQTWRWTQGFLTFQSKFCYKFFLQFLADFSQNKLFGSPWWCWQPFSVLLETFGTPKLWFKSKQLKSVFIGRDFPQSNDTVSKTFISLSGDNKARVLNALSKAVGGHDVPNSLVHTIDSLDKALTFYR